MAIILAALSVTFAFISAMLHHRKMAELDKRVKNLEQILVVEEYRCPDCTDRATCPAAGSGTLFPCGNFHREDLYSS